MYKIKAFIMHYKLSIIHCQLKFNNYALMNNKIYVTYIYKKIKYKRYLYFVKINQSLSLLECKKLYILYNYKILEY